MPSAPALKSKPRAALAQARHPVEWCTGSPQADGSVARSAAEWCTGGPQVYLSAVVLRLPPFPNLDKTQTKQNHRCVFCCFVCVCVLFFPRQGGGSKKRAHPQKCQFLWSRAVWSCAGWLFPMYLLQGPGNASNGCRMGCQNRDPAVQKWWCPVWLPFKPA